MLSLAESTLFRKLAKPVTIPAKLWLTLNFVQRVGGRKNDNLDGNGATIDGDTKGRRTPKATAASKLAKGEKGASGADMIVVEREGAGGKQSSSNAGGWGGGRSKRRRKAICPPGTRGGTPGCFVSAFPAAAAATARVSPLLAS